jgi:ABC-type multidrug transport system fused ATPase/permease subunit
LAALFMAFFQGIGVASILPFMNLIMHPEAIYDNKLIYWVYNLLGFTNINSFIFFLGFFMLGIIVVGNLVSTLAVWVQLRFAWRKHHNISTSLLKKYLSLPYVYFLDHHSADLSKNILTETLELTQNFIIPMLKIITKGVVVIFILGMIFIAEPVIAFLAALVVGGLIP